MKYKIKAIALDDKVQKVKNMNNRANITTGIIVVFLLGTIGVYANEISTIENKNLSTIEINRMLSVYIIENKYNSL